VLATLFIDTIVSLLFASAAAGKLVSWRDFHWQIRSYRLLPPALVPAAAVTLLLCELAVCILFGIGWTPAAAERGAFALLLTFTLLLERKRRLTGHTACRCIGGTPLLDRYPRTRNLSLLVLLAVHAGLPSRVPLDTAAFVLAAAWLAIAFAAYYRGHTRLGAVEELIEKAGGYRPPTGVTVLYVDYASPQFDAVDRLLARGGFTGDFVLFKGPQWLLEIKRQVWTAPVRSAVPSRFLPNEPFIYERPGTRPAVLIGEVETYLAHGTKMTRGESESEAAVVDRRQAR